MVVPGDNAGHSLRCAYKKGSAASPPGRGFVGISSHPLRLVLSDQGMVVQGLSLPTQQMPQPGGRRQSSGAHPQKEAPKEPAPVPTARPCCILLFN